MQPVVEYFPIRTFVLPYISGQIPFDIYLRLGSQKFTKVLASGQPMDITRFEAYIQKGTEHFYLSKADRYKYLTLSARVIATTTTKDFFEREDAQQLIDELAEQTLKEIAAQSQISILTLKTLETLIGTYADLALNQPHILPALLRLARTKSSYLKHQTMTAIFSTLLARAINDNRSFISSCGFAGFLHDVGISLLNLEVDEHAMNLNPQQFEILKQHPLRAAALLAESPDISSEIMKGIAQHHEGFDGKGYPFGLKGELISLTARVVGLTETFTALITGGDGSIPLPPGMAGHALLKNTQVDPKLLDVFMKLLKL